MLTIRETIKVWVERMLRRDQDLKRDQGWFDFRNIRILTKLNLFFIPLPVFIIGFGGYLLLHNTKQYLLDGVFIRLETISKLKEEKVLQFVEDRVAKVKTIAGILESDEELFSRWMLGSFDDQRFFQKLDLMIKHFHPLFRPHDILISDMNGQVVYSFNPDCRDIHRREDHNVRLVLMEQMVEKTYIGRVQIKTGSQNAFSMLFSSELHDKANNKIGYLVIEESVDELYSLLADNTGLGETGETFLVKIGNENEIVYLSPIRHVDNAVLKGFTYMGSDLSMDAQYALLGQSGMDFIFDYRHKEVLSNWRSLPKVNWGLVVKLDKAEALREINNLEFFVKVVGVLFMMILFIFSWKMAQKISEPLRLLYYNVDHLSEGQWKLPEELRTQDEVGQLAQAFDRVLSLVKERTDALAQENLARKNVNQLLEQNKKDLETLLYVTSHDLKEPLRAIEFFSNSVREQFAQHIEEKGQDYLRRTIEAAKRMNLLLDEILTLSRTRKIVKPSKPYPCKEMVQDALQRLQSKIALTKARIHIHENLPDIFAEPFWAIEAFYNLIGNALKFVKEGETPDIEIAPYLGEKGIGVSVLDRGLGVPKEYSESIFGLFKRAVSRNIEGTGAGLAIVREIAERHGGKAWVEAREGGGSIFSITFGQNIKA